MTDLDKEFDNEPDLDAEFDNEVDLDSEFDNEPEANTEMTLEQKARMALPNMPTAEDMRDTSGLVSTIEPPKEGEMGPLEAAAIHAAPSMTLGLSDVLAGASGAAGHAYGSLMEGHGIPSKDELLDTYYEAKKGEGKRREKAMEDQPAASIGGMLGGGALLTMASGPVGGVLSKYGKVGKLAANVLPNSKGFSEAARIAKLAKTSKDMTHLYQTYKKLRAAALAKAALTGLVEGSKAGAIMNSTMGEAELMNGDLAGTVKDAVEGAASGGLVGGLMSGSTALTSLALDAFPGTKSVVESFVAGRKGHELNHKYIDSNTEKLTRSFLKDMTKKFKTLGDDRDTLIKNAKRLKTMVKTEDDVADAVELLNHLDSKAFKAKSEDYMSILREHLGKSQEMRKIEEALIKKQTQMNQMDLGLDEAASRKLAKDQISQVLRNGKTPTKVTEGNVNAKDIIDTNHDIKMKVQQRNFETANPITKSTEITPTSGKIRTGVDPETGLEFGAIKNNATGKETIKVGGTPVTQLVDGKATLDDAINLKKQIEDYTFLHANDKVPNEVKKNATKLVKQLQTRIDEAIAEGNPDVNLSEFNNKFNKLYNSFETIKVSTKPVSDVEKHEQLQKLSNFITSSNDSRTFSNLREFLRQLNIGAPEIAKKYGNEIKQMRKLVELSAGTEYIPLGANQVLTTLIGTIGGAINRAANLAGRVSKPIISPNVIKRTLASQTRKMTEASPEVVQNLINKISTSKNKSYETFKPVLEKLVGADDRRRASIMWGLMQQKEFRQLVDELHESDEDYDLNDM